MTRRSFWTPQYVLDKSLEVVYRRRHAEAPWLTRAAVRFLDDWLRGTDSVVEFGAGRSTIWLAQRSRRVISVETDDGWAQWVATALAKRQMSDKVQITRSTKTADYLEPLRVHEHERFDLALVDGGQRDLAAMWASTRLNTNGILVLDNADRYLPSASRAPFAVVSPKSVTWERFAERTADWRCYWTSNGVWDTAIFFKP